MMNVADKLFDELPPRTGIWSGHALDRDDGFSDGLAEMGVCRWVGGGSPLLGYVITPVPFRLGRFEAFDVNWFDGVHPDDAERVRRNVVEALRGVRSAPFEYRILNGEGDLVWVRHSWSKKMRTTASGSCGYVTGIIQIIDERKKLEAECIRVCERERQLIGQELHDDVCQVLAGLACMLARFGGEIKAVIPYLAPMIDELGSQVNGAMMRARSLAHCLVPLRLVDVGLPTSLDELARQSSASSGLKVMTHYGTDLLPHSAEQILHVYRIAQEAINNATKHSGATRIDVKLKREGNAMCLTVQDNGRGLPLQAAATDGLGLHIMRYRAVAIGGRFTITRAPAGGTLVTVQYPEGVARGQELKYCA